MVGARSFDLDDTGEVFAVYSVKARVVCVGLGGVLGQVASTGVCVPFVPLVPSGTPLASVMAVVFSRVECSPQVLYSSRPDGTIVVVVVVEWLLLKRQRTHTCIYQRQELCKICRCIR